MLSLKTKAALVVVGIFGLFMIVNVGLAFGTVPESQAAVETHWGQATGEVHQSGSYWLGTSSGIPFLPNGFAYGTERINVEPVTMTQESNALSQDGQDINAVVSVTYRVKSEEAGSFYADSESSAPFRSTEVWEKRVGERAVQSAVQDGAASVSAMEMVENFDDDDGANIEILRTQLQKEVNKQLRAETNQVSPEVEILEVRVENVDLSNELDKGLEDIAVERTKAEQKIIEAEADADAKRARAQGDADAFDTKVEAYGSEEKALQSEWIEAIRQDDGTIVLDSEAAPILDLNEAQNSTAENESESDSSGGN